jgi:hypothetical protein
MIHKPVRLRTLVGPKIDKKSERSTRLEIEQLKSDLVSIELLKKKMNPTTDHDAIDNLATRARDIINKLAEFWDEEERTKKLTISIPTSYTNPRDSGFTTLSLPEREKYIRSTDPNTTNRAQKYKREKYISQLSNRDRYVKLMRDGLKVSIEDAIVTINPDRSFLLQLLHYRNSFVVRNTWNLVREYYEDDNEVQAGFVARCPVLLNTVFRYHENDKNFFKMVLAIPNGAGAILYANRSIWSDPEIMKLLAAIGGIGQEEAYFTSIRFGDRHALKLHNGPWESSRQLNDAMVSFPDDILLEAIKNNAYNIGGASPKQAHDANFLRKAVAINPKVQKLVKYKWQNTSNPKDLSDNDDDSE